MVYVDGFNLYYGAVRGGPYKWLNLQRYFQLVRNDDDVQKVRYFTALLQGSKQVRQLIYLQALSTLPLVDVVLGKFKTKKVKCLVPPCSHAGDRLFQTQEEKRTDVNIGVRLLDDAYQNAADRFIVVSGDSDLVPALAMVRQRFPGKELIVYVPSQDPTRGAAVELRSAAHKNRTLPLNLLKYAQLPARLVDGAGNSIAKPPTW